jgi:hypothetical protein
VPLRKGQGVAPVIVPGGRGGFLQKTHSYLSVRMLGVATLSYLIEVIFFRNEKLVIT